MDSALGAFLRELRRTRGRSLREWEARAGIARSTLGRWESGQHQPRLPELNAALDALEATPIERQRALDLMGAPRATVARAALTPKIWGSEDLAPPGPGELLRAMRMRRGLTRQEAAHTLGVHRSCLSRWESSHARPDEELAARLWRLYGATEFEQTALTRSYSFAQACDPGEPETVEALERRLDSLNGRSWDGGYELMDLEFLALQSGCWRMLRSEPEPGWSLLMRAYVWHGQWLLWRRRFDEAAAAAQRGQDLASSLKHARSILWSAMTIAQSQAARGTPNGYRSAAASIESARGAARTARREDWVDAELAEYLSAGGDPESARLHLGPALQTVDDNYWSERSRRWLEAKILLREGHPEAGIQAMPKDDQPNVHQKIEERLTWSGLLLGVGEHSEAQKKLSEARSLSAQHALTFSEIDGLADRL